MRWMVPNFITEDEADWLRSLRSSSKIINREELADIFARIAFTIEDLTDCKLSMEKPSYNRIESRSEGHPVHIDTGTKGHMLWCAYGSTLLFQKSDTGGQLIYPELGESVSPEEHYLSLVFHSSDEPHEVSPSSGDRKVLLCFFALEG